MALAPFSAPAHSTVTVVKMPLFAPMKQKLHLCNTAVEVHIRLFRIWSNAVEKRPELRLSKIRNA